MTTYALVEMPGTDREQSVETGLPYKQAMRLVKECYTGAEQEEGFIQIMREGPEGLTSEF